MSVQNTKNIAYIRDFENGDYLKIPDDSKIYKIKKINNVFVQHVDSDGDIEEILNPDLRGRYFLFLNGVLHIGEFDFTRTIYPFPSFKSLLVVMTGSDVSIGRRNVFVPSKNIYIDEEQLINTQVYSCDLLNLPEYEDLSNLLETMNNIRIYNSNVEKMISTRLKLPKMPNNISMLDKFLGGKKYKSNNKHTKKSKKSKKSKKTKRRQYK